MTIENLGNVVGLIKGVTPPAKTYVLWAKQLSPLTNPNLVEINYHDGSVWRPIGSANKKRVVPLNNTLLINEKDEIHFAENLYNKGTIIINTDADSDYGGGMNVQNYGIMRVDGVIYNEGLILNNGLIIN